MVSAENLLNNPEFMIPFTVHNDDYDKQLGADISNNNKPIVFFSIILRNTTHKYTTPYKELLSIVERRNQF